MPGGPKKCAIGPGYATPMDAFLNGPREKILYTTTVQPNLEEPHGDYLSTVDVDPESPTYCQVIHRTFTNTPGNELHHSGWNACSSCHLVDVDCCKVPKRNRLICPSLHSDNIYIFDVATDERKPEIVKIISGDSLKSLDLTAPHTTHCLADGNIMISTLGDREGNAKGDFVLLDSEFNLNGTWTKGEKKAQFGYDYWYQPYFNVMIASEWGAPKLFRKGFNPSDVSDPAGYGRSLNVYKWKEQTLLQTIDLGEEGLIPLEVRFLHNPKECQGFVGTALHSKVFRFYQKPGSELFEAKKVIDIPPKKVLGWPGGDEIEGTITDILLSLDDKYLYFSNWLHGDVRQYDISDPANPKLTGQVFIGGLVHKESGVTILEDKELTEQPEARYIKGRKVEGGPQMLQLSLDGKRLYVTTSLTSQWDKQFYPKMISAGGIMAQIDCDIENGGMKLNENFLVDFGKEPYGPTLAHEMRYPGGDSTSDIWLVDSSIVGNHVSWIFAAFVLIRAYLRDFFKIFRFKGTKQ